MSFVVREFSEESETSQSCVCWFHSSDRLANVVNSADTLVARCEITSSVLHPCDH